MFDESLVQPSSLALTLASYNIHRCFGTDGKYHPERTGVVMEGLDADLIGLQEVDMSLLVDGRNQLDYFAETLAMHAVAGSNVKGRRGKFGNALLSRWPVRTVRRIDLSVRHLEPRGALDCDLDVDGQRLRVVVTHLGLNAAERRLQVRRLIAALNDGPSGVPTIVMGDFNEWKPTRGALRALDRHLGISAMPLTFPSRLPLLPLDRIWAWPAEGMVRQGVYTTPLSRITSDHLPLRAEIAWVERGLPDRRRYDATITNV